MPWAFGQVYLNPWASLVFPSCQLRVVLLSIAAQCLLPGVCPAAPVSGVQTPCPPPTPGVGAGGGLGVRWTGVRWGASEGGEEQPQWGWSRWPGLGWEVSWESKRPGDQQAPPATWVPRDKYQVFDSAPRGLLRAEELEDQGQTLANVFILRLLENSDDREATYMLKASSQ